MANANDQTRPATLTVRLDQFQSLDAFVRGYRQHVTRTSIYLPTRVPRAEGSLLLFRIELADGSCAFRGEGLVESFRHTPGGEQLGLTLRLRRLDKASKDLHTAVFVGAVESVPQEPAVAPVAVVFDDLAAAVGAAADEVLSALHPAVAPPVREPALVARTEGESPARMRDDLRPTSRTAPETAPRAAEPAPEAEGSEQAQALGRMAVARMSVDEYEARKAAMARVAAPPPVASLVASSESTAAWSEADDALDFEGIGSDIRENVPSAPEPPAAPAPIVLRDEEPLPPAPTLPPLESIIVAPPEEAAGGGVAVAEVTFAGSAAYEMPKSAPVETTTDLDLEFDFTAVSFTEEESLSRGLSGSRPALTSSAVTAARPVASVVTTPSSAVSNAVTRPVETVERPAPVPAPAPAPVPAPSPAAGPSRLPPAPPPKSGLPAPVSAGGAPGSRPAVPMSKPVPKPSAPVEEEKPGLFGWLRGKK